MFSFLKHTKPVDAAIRESQVGCFGKLPIYDEFIRHNVNARSVLELDEWVQQGYFHHSKSLQTTADQLGLQNYTYHFVFTGSGESPSSVIGAMMGSHDKCGRQYPFVLFKMLPNQYTESLSSSLPCAYQAFFDNAINLCSTDWSLQPINMLKKRVDALNVMKEPISRAYLMESEIIALDAIRRDDFWREMLGDDAKDKAPVYIEVMKDLLATVVRKLPLRTSWGIEIPLPANERTHVHVSFWVRVAETMLGCRGWRPHYIWGDVNDPVNQSLYLFFRPVTPIFFSHLLGRRADNGILINLRNECKNQNQVSEMARKIAIMDPDDHMVSAFDEWSSWGSI
jgi:type VI secretion system protein ImpM